MRNKNKANAEEIAEILAESRSFRGECEKVCRVSKKLLNTSSGLIDEYQALMEEKMILLEEMIVKKSEACSIMEIGFGDSNALSRDDPAYISYMEERKIVLDRLEVLSNIQISSDNLPLLNLRKMFLNLPFLPKRGLDC